MTAIKIRALPKGFDDEHVRAAGEPILCTYWDARKETNCSGATDVEIAMTSMVWKRERGHYQEETLYLHLCREHASWIARQINEAVLLADGRDLLTMGEEP